MLGKPPTYLPTYLSTYLPKGFPLIIAVEIQASCKNRKRYHKVIHWLPDIGLLTTVPAVGNLLVILLSVHGQHTSAK
jgi:hypothetical protein